MTISKAIISLGAGALLASTFLTASASPAVLQSEKTPLTVEATASASISASVIATVADNTPGVQHSASISKSGAGSGTGVEASPAIRTETPVSSKSVTAGTGLVSDKIPTCMGLTEPTASASKQHTKTREVNVSGNGRLDVHSETPSPIIGLPSTSPFTVSNSSNTGVNQPTKKLPGTSPLSASHPHSPPHIVVKSSVSTRTKIDTTPLEPVATHTKGASPGFTNSTSISTGVPGVPAAGTPPTGTGSVSGETSMAGVAGHPSSAGILTTTSPVAPVSASTGFHLSLSHPVTWNSHSWLPTGVPEAPTNLPVGEHGAPATSSKKHHPSHNATSSLERTLTPAATNSGAASGVVGVLPSHPPVHSGSESSMETVVVSTTVTLTRHNVLESTATLTGPSNIPGHKGLPNLSSSAGAFPHTAALPTRASASHETLTPPHKPTSVVKLHVPSPTVSLAPNGTIGGPSTVASAYGDAQVQFDCFVFLEVCLVSNDYFLGYHIALTNYSMQAQEGSTKESQEKCIKEVCAKTAKVYSGDERTCSKAPFCPKV